VQPTSDDVRRQLDRLLASEGFAYADRMSGFLRYVVDRALAGESDQVKEYVIGVDVFGRDEHYDPRLDSIVRVEARRLRTKIDEYYAGPGSKDPVIIRMRRGSYVPAFEQREPGHAISPPSVPIAAPTGPVRKHPGLRLAIGLATATALLVSLAAWRTGIWATDGRQPAVTVAVLPFQQFSTDPADELLAARLTDGVTAELARTRTVGVVSRTSAQQSGIAGKPLREVAQALNANVVMEGSLTRDGERIRVNARLVDAATDRKYWVEGFDAPINELPDLQRRIAIAAAAAAAQAPSARR
jgi:TolB-like protein